MMMSSIYAIECARDGVWVLLISTNLAHNMSDVFDRLFTDKLAAVTDELNLDAAKTDPETKVREHLMGTKQVMGDRVSPVMINEINRQTEMAH